MEEFLNRRQSARRRRNEIKNRNPVLFMLFQFAFFIYVNFALSISPKVCVLKFCAKIVYEIGVVHKAWANNSPRLIRTNFDAPGRSDHCNLAMVCGETRRDQRSFWGFYTLLGSSSLEVLDLLIDPLSIKHISGRVYITQIAEYGRTTSPNTRTSSEMFRDEMFCLKNSDILNDCKVDSGLMMQAALGRPCEKFKETSIKF